MTIWEEELEQPMDEMAMYRELWDEALSDSQRATNARATFTKVSDPFVKMLIKAEETSAERMAAHNEAAVVALSEALADIDGAMAAQSELPLSFLYVGRMYHQLVAGGWSVLDLAEIDFATADDLFDKLEQLGQRIDSDAFDIWELRARAASMRGDDEAASRWIERIFSTINWRKPSHDDGCPFTRIGIAAWLLGPHCDLAKLETRLGPTFQAFDTRGDGCDACRPGMQTLLVAYGRALLHAKQYANARQHITKAFSFGRTGSFLLPDVAMLEIAIADGQGLTAAMDHLRPLIDDAQDAEEKFWAEVRMATATRLSGGDEAPWRAAAITTAEKLDKRVGRSVHVPLAAREIEQPAFLS